MAASNAKVISRSALDAGEAQWTKLVKVTYQDPSGKQRQWEERGASDQAGIFRRGCCWNCGYP